jgi:hypothetical protein
MTGSLKIVEQLLEWELVEEIEELGENLPFYPPQIPHDLRSIPGRSGEKRATNHLSYGTPFPPTLREASSCSATQRDPKFYGTRRFSTLFTKARHCLNLQPDESSPYHSILFLIRTNLPKHTKMAFGSTAQQVHLLCNLVKIFICLLYTVAVFPSCIVLDSFTCIFIVVLLN